MALCAALGTATLSPSTFARETDQFTDRKTTLATLRDSETAINQWVNLRLNTVLSQIRQLPSPPTSEQVLELLEEKFLDPVMPELMSPIEIWVLSTTGQRELEMDAAKGRGIYRHGTPMQLKWTFLTGVANTLKIHDTYAGEDKLGHFFAQGFSYFKKAQELRKQGATESEVKEALREFGHETEIGVLGFENDAVYSPADLAANWAGWKFWERLVGTSKPYFSKTGATWERKSDFKISEYISDDWDEFYNPSYVENGRVDAAVKKAIQETCDDWIKTGRLEFAEGTRTWRATTVPIAEYRVPENRLPKGTHRITFSCKRPITR
jgi:hypothetical protein